MAVEWFAAGLLNLASDDVAFQKRGEDKVTTDRYWLRIQPVDPKLTVGLTQLQIEQAGLSPNRSTNLTR